MDNIKPVYARTYAFIASKMDANRQVRVPYAEIANTFGFDKRTAKRHTQRLAENNLIRIIPTTGDNRQGLLYEIL
jgi:DNA-binding MarR family transcriptional regulator